MKKHIKFFMIICMTIFQTNVLFTQTNGHMVIDSLDVNGVYYLKITWDGVQHPTEWYKNEGDYVRFYGKSDHGVFPEVYYLVKKNNLNIGESWNGWLNGPVSIEVVDTATISVPFGTFFTYKMTYSDIISSQIEATRWFAKNIGWIKSTSGGTTYVLDSASIQGGSGFFPLYEGNEWRASPPSANNIDIDIEKYFTKIYQLNQNYPNPFNPITTISFSIPINSKVELSIYNVIGKKIKTIVHDNLQMGYHTFVWNGKDKSGKPLSSGIYFYRIETDKFSDIKKAILLK